LSPEEYHALVRMARSRKLAAGRVKRAQLVLLSNQGSLAPDVADRLVLHEKTVRRWVGRFNRLGLPGLEEGPRNGRPPVYSPQDVGVVLATALTPPEALGLPFASWTLDRLVAYLSGTKGIPMKRSRLSEIFRHEGLRWRQHEGWFGERADPAFAETGNGAIERRSTRPPGGTVVSCVDEMGPLSARTHAGQALVRPRPAPTNATFSAMLPPISRGRPEWHRPAV
jgi:transposase